MKILAQITNGKFQITELKELTDWIATQKDGLVVVDVRKIRNQRTILQNRALHKYFTLISEELNAQGLTMQKVFARAVDVRWTPKSVKECLWRPLQVASINRSSTTELTTKDPTIVYDTVNLFLSENFYIYIPFPSKESFNN